MNFIKLKTILNTIYFFKKKIRRHDQLDGEDLLLSSGGKKSPYKGTGPKTKHGKGKKSYKRDKNSGADQHETKNRIFFFRAFCPFLFGGTKACPSASARRSTTPTLRSGTGRCTGRSTGGGPATSTATAAVNLRPLSVCCRFSL